MALTNPEHDGRVDRQKDRDACTEKRVLIASCSCAGWKASGLVEKSRLEETRNYRYDETNSTIVA